MFALHKATIEMNVDMVRTLLEAHAEVNLPDGNGQTPLHILCKKLNWRFDIAPEVCETLLKYGAWVNKPSPVKITPIPNLPECDTAIVLTIYIFSAGGDIPFVFNSIRMPQLLGYFKVVSMDMQQVSLDILYESGTVLPTLNATGNNSKLVSCLTLRKTNPRCLLRLAADVLRKTMKPNAWVGLTRLSIPPGFDREYIIFNARSIVSTWFKG